MTTSISSEAHNYNTIYQNNSNIQTSMGLMFLNGKLQNCRHLSLKAAEKSVISHKIAM